MAGVISKPEALSFSGNMNKFVLSSSDVVLFSLKRGNTLLFEQSYEPGPDGMIRIDVKNVIEDQLNYTFNVEQTVYTQVNLFADFTATINNNDYSFRVIRGGVANLADTPSNWLKQHFLTWQPRVKQVTYYSPEWLTYYAVEACTIKLKATYPDKTTRNLSLKSCPAGTAITINLQYSVIAGKLDNTYPSYYEVWTETAGGTKLADSQFYAFSDVLSEDEQWYLFENSLGGLDTFRAYGTNNLNAEHEYNIAELGDVRKEYQVDTERKYTKNTGYLDDYERRWLLDFFPSQAKYVYEASGIRKIVVTESNVTYVSSELPSSYTFTWQLAEVSALLNLVKNEIEIPDNLVAPNLSSPDFILPPRLAEFPRVQLSEGVLIPAFDPFNPKPTVTTFGAIHDTIKNAVVKELEDELSGIIGGGGSGGSDIYIIKTNDLTIPTDQNVFSAKRTLQEIDSLLIEANEMFLRKDIPDIAHDIITFDKKIGSSIFLDGMDGKGWEIKENGDFWLGSAKVRDSLYAGNKIGSISFAPGFPGHGVEIDMPTATITADNLFARKNFTANTITYSQIYGLGGNQVVSDINKIARVETLSDRYRCYMDSLDGLMLMNMRIGDGARIQSRTSVTSVKYLIGRVINISSDYFDIDIDLLEGTGVPASGDYVLRWGNDRDTTRQGLIYLTSADQGSPFVAVYDGITGTSTKDKLKVQFGNISNIRTKRGVQLKGYGAYLEGAFIENSSVILNNGMTVEQQFIVMNGEFNSTIEGLKNDISLEAGNILRNSSFSRDKTYWESLNDVHFINAGEGFLWLDGSFYVEKNAIADIYRDGNKNVLRILNTSIKQRNENFTNEAKEGTYSFSFFCKVLRSGTLSVGFSSQGLFLTRQLDVSDSYIKISKTAAWNGDGDFSISFTGEILIYGVSLFNDALADAVINLQTQITQNAEAIKLTATKEYVDGETGKIYTYYNSQFQITAGEISAISTKVDTINDTIDTAGWITNTQGNNLYAAKKMENGATIISTINQTAEEVAIEASKIRLEGIVTANNKFKVLLDGSIEAVDGRFSGTINADSGSIGGFEIKDGRIESSALFQQVDMVLDPSGGIYFNESNSKFARMGPATLAPSSGITGLLAICDAETDDGLHSKTLINLFVGRSVYSDVPQVWMDCKHFNNTGWGSAFKVESRYLGNADAQERTCINVGALMDFNQIKKISGQEPELYPLYWDNKSQYVCYKY